VECVFEGICTPCHESSLCCWINRSSIFFCNCYV